MNEKNELTNEWIQFQKKQKLNESQKKTQFKVHSIMPTIFT